MKRLKKCWIKIVLVAKNNNLFIYVPKNYFFNTYYDIFLNIQLLKGNRTFNFFGYNYYTFPSRFSLNLETLICN